MLAEVGTGTTSGDPVAWVDEAMTHFVAIDGLHAVVWFDHSYDSSVDFRLDDDQLAALRRVAAQVVDELQAAGS